MTGKHSRRFNKALSMVERNKIYEVEAAVSLLQGFIYFDSIIFPTDLKKDIEIQTKL